MKVRSVNVAVPRPNPTRTRDLTGIDKRPVPHAVEVRAPGPRTTGLHSGVVGDVIGDVVNHGGDDQAVYAYAREDHDWWAAELGRELADGVFGENLTTTGADLGGAVIGEVWKVGDVLELQVTFGRIPCITFQAAIGVRRWIKRFTEANRPGVYLRVVTPGSVRAGDPIDVVRRPSHGMTIAEGFRIYMRRTDDLSRLLEIEELPADRRAGVRRRLMSKR